MPTKKKSLPKWVQNHLLDQALSSARLGDWHAASATYESLRSLQDKAGIRRSPPRCIADWMALEEAM